MRTNCSLLLLLTYKGQSNGPIEQAPGDFPVDRLPSLEVMTSFNRDHIKIPSLDMVYPHHSHPSTLEVA